MHPQPRPDEILSSWMVRLAFSNGFPLHTFYDKLLGYGAPIWSRDIDRQPANELVSILSQCSGQKIPAIQLLTLGYYQGSLFENLNSNGNSQWIVPVGVFHRVRVRAGMQFCSMCLKQDETPYFRRSWRLAITALCPRHRCIMNECCPACFSPIVFHRHGMGREKLMALNALAFCYHCRHDLREITPIYPDWQDCVSLGRYASMLANFDEAGWQCGLPSIACNIPFFRGAYQLINFIRGRNGHAVCATLGRVFDVSLSTHRSGRHIEFEHLPPVNRLNLLLVFFWLIDDWPTRFLAVFYEARVTRSRILQDESDPPFWLSSVVDKHLDMRTYRPTEAEIFSASKYVLSTTGGVTPLTLGRALGLRRDGALSAWKTWRSAQ